METYLKFNPLSTIRVEETRIVEGYQVVLRHIPKRGSIVINGFMEVASDPAPYQFACQYSNDSVYREANRVLIFNPANNAQEFLISYIAVGTVITADDMNEIKAHLENQELHGSADNFFHKVGNFVCFPYVTGNKSSWSVAQYEQDFQSYAGRPSQNYDIVLWNDSGMTNGWAIRVGDKWFNLGVDTYNAGQLQSGWEKINPILSIKDRQKLDSLADVYQIGDGLKLEGNVLSVDWSKVQRIPQIHKALVYDSGRNEYYIAAPVYENSTCKVYSYNQINHTHPDDPYNTDPDLSTQHLMTSDDYESIEPSTYDYCLRPVTPNGNYIHCWLLFVWQDDSFPATGEIYSACHYDGSQLTFSSFEGDDAHLAYLNIPT